jgi:hypothetical protein
MQSIIEKRDKLVEAIKLCSIHFERMSFAYQQIKNYFPLTEQTYKEIAPLTLSLFDQLIFRFSKLQDCMGNKLFSALLINLEEDIKGKPFIDILNKLEELNLITSNNDWLLLRETSNLVTHEYPFITNELIEGLNLLSNHIGLLTTNWLLIKDFSVKRFKIND